MRASARGLVLGTALALAGCSAGFSGSPRLSSIDPLAPQNEARTTWRLRGSPIVMPSSISDDGQRIYLEWRSDAALPAVFAVDPAGGEQVVDGYMRGRIFTIDRLHSKLIFVIDRNRAEATRQLERSQ